MRASCFRSRTASLAIGIVFTICFREHGKGKGGEGRAREGQGEDKGGEGRGEGMHDVSITFQIEENVATFIRNI